MSNILKLIRVEQWLKNLLIFSIPIFANQFDKEIFFELLNIFFGFSFIASSGYIVNDIFDLESDKNHYLKSKRVLAAGIISVSNAKKIFIVIFSFGCLVLALENLNALFLSLVYLLLSTLYSKYLKYFKYIDLVLISSFFVLRVYLGSISTGIEASLFLILLIYFSSLSIVTGKKLSILLDKKIKISKIKETVTKNYDSNFLNKLQIFSIIATFITFNFWIFFGSETVLIFIFSDIFLILFSLKFYKLTKESKTEDFINVLKSEKAFSLNIFLFILFTLFGIVF